MTARIAYALLGASALLLLGHDPAQAQDRPQPPTDRPTPPRQRPPRDDQQPADEARRQQQQAQESEPEEEGGDDLPSQFRTGVEYEPMSPRAKVTFNLENADLPELVRLISNITGRRFILPGKVRNIEASVYAPTRVPVAAAYEAFLSILEINGMTVVPSGRYLKIVETQGVESRSLPTGQGRVPTDDRYVTHIQGVDNVSAEDASSLLERFKSDVGSITAYAPTNMLIVTDTGSNIRRMMRILRAIDVPRTGEQIWIEPIHYANAAELAEKLQEIFPVGEESEGGGKSDAQQSAAARARARAQARARARAGKDGDAGGGGTTTVGSRSGASRVTKIIPEERSNSLIIMATERAYLRVLELIRQLDVPLEGEGRIHVHYVQHTDAEEIASTLESLVQGGGGGGGRTAQRRRGQQQQGGGDGAASASLFEGEVQVTSHEATNALVITSSLHDYAELRRVIERLDAPRRQVFIEAVIMELSVSRSNELGFAFHGGLEDSPGDGGLTVLGFEAAQSVLLEQSVLTGMAVGVAGPTIPESAELVGQSIPAFGVVINALANSSDTNVLSTPHIIAMDNTEAEISVGENVPLQTSGIPLAGALGGVGGLGGLGGLLGGQTNQQQQQQGRGALGAMGGLGGFGGVQRQDTGTTVRITPHINDQDEIRLEIEEEISEPGPTEGQLGVRSIRQRSAQTEVMVRDNQTVVIGGLMRDEVTHTETKIPVLGDIPVLGMLFRQTEKQKRKTNLLLFLTPYIIRDPSDLRAIFERKMRERQEFLDRYFVFGDAEYTPPIDYSRTRGLVAEILNEVKAIEVEHELQREAETKAPPEHKPRPPVGSASDLGAIDPNEGMVIEPDEEPEADEPEPEPEPEAEQPEPESEE
ncbi:MAG: type II secretion system secretin GspD [Myxococcota bacterium]